MNRPDDTRLAEDAKGARERTATAIAELRARLGERCLTGAAVRAAHGRGESWHPVAAPDAVCLARSTDEVAGIVSACAAHRVPIVPFGAGTSIEGQLAALRGGVSIDLSGMDRILEVHAEDMDCRVEAGVRRRALNAHLRDTGLFFPVDPGADASLGGMAATRASGTNAVRYGTMRENVMGLTYVDAAGRVVRTGTRARKSSAGYDLTRLLVGSEGTLGVITELALKLSGLPEAVRAAVVHFPGVDAAVRTVIDVIRVGVPMARIELVDRASMRAIRAYSGIEQAEADTLFLEFHGTEAGVAEQVATFEEIAAGHGAGPLVSAAREEDRTRLWRARHDAYYALKAAHPGREGLTTDVCVPISRLAEAIAGITERMADSPFAPEVLGHVGDGNFHLIFWLRPDRPEDLAAALELNDRLVEDALAVGGTCTGEHGIGTGKLKYLRREHGDAAVDTMRAIKRALDPDDLMNPGKTVAG